MVKKILLSFLCIIMLIISGCSGNKINSKDVAINNMKSMSDTDLQNNMKIVQFDNSGVGLACVVQLSPNDNTIAVANIRITNKEKSLYTAYTDLSLIDEDGNVYPPDNQTFALDNRLPDRNIKDGESVQGIVLFKIPKNKSKFLIKYDYDTANNKSYYKPILVSKTQSGQITKQEDSSNNNTNKSNSGSTDKNQNGISNAGIQISETKFEVYQDICPRLRAQFKLKNISNSTIYLNSKSFCLRQDGGNAIDVNTTGGGYSYNNSGTILYDMQPIHLKTGDTCDVGFDFDLNRDKPNKFELYYIDSLGNLVLVTKIN